MKLFLISSDNKASDLYDRLKYFIIVMHLEIVLFENSYFIISVVRRFTWWVIHLTGNICGYFSFTSFLLRLYLKRYQKLLKKIYYILHLRLPLKFLLK